MEQRLKQRLLGTVVLVATAVIVLPALLDGEGYKMLQAMNIETPQKPLYKYQQEYFTAPLKEQTARTELLTPPPHKDIKAFNESGEATGNGRDDANQQSSALKSSDNAASRDSSTETEEETTTWLIQVGSFSVEENALEARRKLAAMNALNTVVEIQTRQANGQDIYVVTVISDSYATVSKIAEDIKKDYPDAFIKEQEKE